MVGIRVIITRRDFKSRPDVGGRWFGLRNTMLINHDIVYNPEKIPRSYFKNTLFGRFKKSLTIGEAMEMSMEERFFFLFNHELYHALKTMFWFKYVMASYFSLVACMASVFLTGLFTNVDGIILCATICFSSLLFTYLLYKYLKLLEERKASLLARDHLDDVDVSLYQKVVGDQTG